MLLVPSSFNIFCGKPFPLVLLMMLMLLLLLLGIETGVAPMKLTLTIWLFSIRDFFLKKVGHSRLLFIYFRLFITVDNKQVNKQMFNNILPVTGVEPRTSGIESDRSTN